MNSIGQSSIITGRLVSYSDNYSIMHANVLISGKNGVVSDSIGEFIIKTNTLDKKDTLIITMVGFRKMLIYHLPVSQDTIKLGNIKMFDGCSWVPMADFFCEWYHFSCIRNANKYWQNESNKYNEVVRSTNLHIDNYLYFFEDKYYKISYNSDYYKLKTEIDLAKPYRH